MARPELRGLSSAAGLRIVGAGLFLSLQLAIARLDGAAAVGHWSYVFVVSGALVVVAVRGYLSSAVRYCAVLDGTDEVEYLTLARRDMALGTIGVWLLVGVPALAIAMATDSTTWYLLVLAVCTVPGLLVLRFDQSVWRARGALLRSLAPYMLVVPLGSLAGVVAITPTHLPSPALPVVLVAVVSVAGLVLHVTSDWRQPTASAPKTKRAQWHRSSARMFVSAVGDVVLRTGDIVMLAALAPATEVAVYAVASRAVWLADTPAFAVNMTAAPMAARSWVREGPGEVRRIHCAARRVMRTGTAIVALPVFLLGLSIPWLFGSEFKDALTVVALLFGGFVLAALVGPQSATMNMIGLEKRVSAGSMIGVVFNIGLNAILIPTMGAVGAAIATLAAAIVIVSWNSVALGKALRQ